MKPRTSHSRLYAVLVAALISVAGLFLSGCATPEGNAPDPLPWNQPAGWENTTIGIPF